MKHLGDITKLSGYEVPIVDVITGGSPCQDLSVAGKRAGLAGERSGLFMEQMRIVKEMREQDERTGGPAQFRRCRFMVWENVPGALSSGKPKGADFQAVLQEICRIVCKEAPAVPIPDAGWPGAGCLNGVGDNGIPFSVAWRIHDAQYWGVPQRRRRICVLADFNGTSAARILFDPQFERTSEGGEPFSLVGDSGDKTRPEVSPVGESLSRDFESGGEARETAFEGTGGSVESAVSFQERAGKPGGGQRNPHTT